MREIADVLDKMTAAFAAAYSAKSGKGPEEVKAIMAKETWLTAAEAVAAGFADEIEDEIQVAALFDLSKYEHVPAQLRADGDPSVAGGADPADVVAYCIENECGGLAAGFIREQATMAQVEARVGAVFSIREIVADAKKMNPALVADADDFISSGISVQEARRRVWNALVEQQTPEITSAISADAGLAAPGAGGDAPWKTVVDRMNAQHDAQHRAPQASEPQESTAHEG
jgi:hypothetical protein